MKLHLASVASKTLFNRKQLTENVSIGMELSCGLVFETPVFNA